MSATKKIIYSVIALTVVSSGIAAAAIISNNLNNQKNSQNNDYKAPENLDNETNGATATPIATSTNSVNSQQTGSKFRDGTYTVTANYNTPENIESITVTLALNNGIIESSSFTSGAVNGTSRRYSRLFADNYKPFVVGKSIDTLRLGAIAGASLTTIGFNNALVKVREQASN